MTSFRKDQNTFGPIKQNKTKTPMNISQLALPRKERRESRRDYQSRGREKMAGRSGEIEKTELVC